MKIYTCFLTKSNAHWTPSNLTPFCVIKTAPLRTTRPTTSASTPIKELYQQAQENYWNNVKAEARARRERRDQEDQRQREVERAKLKQEILDKFNNS